MHPAPSTTRAVRNRAVVLDDPSGVLGRMVYDKSEGNPFFMRELTHQLSDPVHDGVGDLAVPYAALELLRRRIASLDDEPRPHEAPAAWSLRLCQLTAGDRLVTSRPREQTSMISST